WQPEKSNWAKGGPMSGLVAAVPSAMPNVLVIGFSVDELLKRQYRGRVQFEDSAAIFSNPSSITVGVLEVWVRSGLEHNDKLRVESLALAANASFNSKISSLVELRKRLSVKFPAGSERPVEPISSGLQAIRSLPCRPNSTFAWVRDHMQFPCDRREESSRLYLLAQSLEVEGSTETFYNTLCSLIGRAGLSAKRANDGLLITSGTPAIKSDVELMQLELETLLEDHNKQHQRTTAALRSI